MTSEEKSRAFLSSLNEPTWMALHRKEMVEKLRRSPALSFRHGLNIVITPGSFDLNKLEAKQNNSVSTEIKYNKEKIHVYDGNHIPLDCEVGQHAERVKRFINWQTEEDNHQLYYFNEAFANNFLLVRITKDSDEEITIRTSTKEQLISHIYILAEKNSNTKIILEKKTETDEALYTSDTIRVIAEEGAKIDITTIQQMNRQTINIQKRIARCKKDATVNWTDTCLGTRYTKSDVVSQLQEEGATTENTVLFLGTKNQEFDIYTASNHEAENTASNIVTKGVVYDKAKALSRGLVNIGKHAADSNGYEKQDVLILSEEAEADAIPNLVIHNNEVKCSHGSTIGQVDQEKLFYLMSRGLKEAEAKKTIVEGYFTPVIDKIKNEKVRERIKTTITEAIQ